MKEIEEKEYIVFYDINKDVILIIYYRFMASGRNFYCEHSVERPYPDYSLKNSKFMCLGVL